MLSGKVILLPADQISLRYRIPTESFDFTIAAPGHRGILKQRSGRVPRLVLKEFARFVNPFKAPFISRPAPGQEIGLIKVSKKRAANFPMPRKLDRSITRRLSGSGSTLQIWDGGEQSKNTSNCASAQKLKSDSYQKYLALDELGQLKALPRATKVVEHIGSPRPCLPPTSNVPKSHDERSIAIIPYGVAGSHTRLAIGRSIEEILCQPHSKVKLRCEPDTTGHERCVYTAQSVHPFFSNLRQRSNRPAIVSHADITSSVSQTLKSSDFVAPSIVAPDVNALKVATKEIKGHLQRHSQTFRLHETLWPPKDLVHVKELLSPNETPIPATAGRQKIPSRRRRKSKVAETQSHRNELPSILQHATKFQNISVSNPHDTSFVRHDSSIQRVIMTGSMLQEHLESQMNCSSLARACNSTDKAAVQTTDAEQHVLCEHSHAAVGRSFNDLPNSLSYYDKGAYAQDLWVDKHAPNSLTCVLQSTQKMEFLRQWMENLTLSKDSTRCTFLDGVKRDYQKEPEPCRKRTRSSSGDLVNVWSFSDEEPTEACGVNDEPTNLCTINTARQKLLDPTKQPELQLSNKEQPNNIILLVGPHGSGKTATVFAMAKDFGLDVFEVNPNSRRSGKDILERVGDMVFNHQMRRDVTFPRDALNPESALADSIMISKQSQMNFARENSQSVPEFESVKFHKVQPTSNCKHAQSLILLEEVDVLFQEDKHFFDAVIELSDHSTRPIIMTCNDEMLLPLEKLNCNAILRFGPIKCEFAIDYLLLIAAKEGHFLSRSAVQYLYTNNGFDLRACISTLNFWCQIGLSGQNERPEWSLKRWPPGVDCDSSGQKLRVLSTNSYRRCTEYSCYGYPAVHSNKLSICENRLVDLISDSIVNLSNLVQSVYLEDLPTTGEPAESTSQAHLSFKMTAFQMSSDLISSMDIFSRLSLPTNYSYDEKLDAKQSVSMRVDATDYVVGYHLLDVTAVEDKQQLGSRLVASIIMRVNHLLRQESSVRTSSLLRSQSLNDQMQSIRQLFHMGISGIVDQENNTHFASFRYGAKPTAEDFGPYIRHIVVAGLEYEQRNTISNGSAAGSRAGKRMRTTRVSRLAQEGSVRGRSNPIRWFTKRLNPEIVLASGSNTWRAFHSSILPDGNTSTKDLAHIKDDVS